MNSAIAIKELVLENNGIALGSIFVIGNELRTGRLKLVLEDYAIQTFGLYAVYSHRRHLSTKVRLFIDLLVERFSLFPRWSVGTSNLEAGAFGVYSFPCSSMGMHT